MKICYSSYVGDTVIFSPLSEGMSCRGEIYPLGIQKDLYDILLPNAWNDL